jgi:hypothetical protein
MRTNPVSVPHKSLIAIGVLVLVIFTAVVTVIEYSRSVMVHLKF